MKKYIFYDLDGTIVDTREDIVLAAKHMVREVKGEDISHEEVYRTVGRGIRHLIVGCLQLDDEKQIERGFQFYRDHYAKHMLDHTQLYPGAQELLERYQGKKQAVVTNKPDPFSTDILKALHADRFFCAIIAGNTEGYPKKPDPTALLSLLKQADIALEDALFIGDSSTDFETGKNAGVQTVLVSHGFSPEGDLRKLNPEYLVSDLRELIKLLDEKGW